LDVFGDGRGCDTVGRFYLSDIAFNLDGTVSRLALDFEQHCTGVTIGPALYGSVRYNSGSKLVPRLAVGGGSAKKGNAGTSDGQVIVSLSMPNSNMTTVQYTTVDGSALASRDYLPTSGTVTFPPGVTAAPVIIPIVGDRLARGNKSFHIQLSNATGAIVGIGSALVPIQDPNGNVTVFSIYGQPGDYISLGETLLTPQDGTCTVAHYADNDVHLSITTIDLWSADFAAANSALLTKGAYLNAQRYPFQAPGLPGLDIGGAGRGCNTLSGNFNVLQAAYDTAGNVKAFGADFEQHCEGMAPALFGSIRVNSKWRQISVSDAVIDQGQSSATFTVTLNPSSPTSVSVQFSTADGTALAGVDYAGLSQTVAFSPGEVEKTVIVHFLNAGAGNKFYGELSDPSGAPLWIQRGSATF
jgi:Calx-beta domain